MNIKMTSFTYSIKRKKLRTKQELRFHIAVKPSFLLKEIFLFSTTLLSFWSATSAYSICVRISVSHFPSCVKNPPSYLNCCTWLLLIYLIPGSHLSLFLMLMTCLFYSISFNTLSKSTVVFLSVCNQCHLHVLYV